MIKITRKFLREYIKELSAEDLYRYNNGISPKDVLTKEQKREFKEDGYKDMSKKEVLEHFMIFSDGELLMLYEHKNPGCEIEFGEPEFYFFSIFRKMEYLNIPDNGYVWTHSQLNEKFEQSKKI